MMAFIFLLLVKLPIAHTERNVQPYSG